MLKIREIIIVEGNYDKAKLSNLVDATIVVTDGFMIYKDKKKSEMLKKMADDNPNIIFIGQAYVPLLPGIVLAVIAGLVIIFGEIRNRQSSITTMQDSTERHIVWPFFPGVMTEGSSGSAKMDNVSPL